VVRTNADVYAVQTALNWACSQVNCAPTSVGGTCFIPNTIWAHSSWAFNAYFNSMNGAQDSCNFSGTAYISSHDPSEYYVSALKLRFNSVRIHEFSYQCMNKLLYCGDLDCLKA
jgi:hypothetical protein